MQSKAVYEQHIFLYIYIYECLYVSELEIKRENKRNSNFSRNDVVSFIFIYHSTNLMCLFFALSTQKAHQCPNVLQFLILFQKGK